jgi:hypothetical protein
VGLAIFGVRLGSGLRLAGPCVAEVLLGGAVCFLAAPSVCCGPNCPPLPRQLEQRMGQIVCGSVCHSEHLDPLLRGKLSG